MLLLLVPHGTYSQGSKSAELQFACRSMWPDCGEYQLPIQFTSSRIAFGTFTTWAERQEPSGSAQRD